jgi:hypothetical protein
MPIDPNINQVPRESKNGTSVVGRLIEKLETKNIPPLKVRFWDKAYAWMSGKKSLTGIALMVGGGLLSLGPGTQVAGYKMLGEGLFALGTTLFGGGLVNKLQKADNSEAGKVIKNDWLSAIIAILKKILELLSKAK